MYMSWALNADSKEHLSFEETDKEQLHVEETDDSCRLEFYEKLPIIRDTDGSCTTECVSGDWSADVKHENPADVKQEPDEVIPAPSLYDLLSAVATINKLFSLEWYITCRELLNMFFSVKRTL